METKEMFALISPLDQVLEIGYTEEELQKVAQKNYPVSETKIVKCYISFAKEVIIKFVPASNKLIDSIKRVRIYLNCGLAEAKTMVDRNMIICPNAGVAIRLLAELANCGTVVDVVGIPDTYKVLYGIKS